MEVAGSRYSNMHSNNKSSVNKNPCIYCERHERVVCWRQHKYFCRERVQHKPTAPPTYSYCPYFCDCWGELFKEPEVRCLCFDNMKACEEAGLW